jgi:hypothetical protein
MVKAFIMAMFIQGLTEQAVKDMAKVDLDTNGFIDEGLIDQAWEQAVSAPPPDSSGFKLFRASMADADRERVLNYSSEYIWTHFWDGYESWWAYATAHNVEDSSRRDHSAGKDYRSGARMGPQNAALVTAKTAAGHDILDRMVRVMGAGRGAAETCCLLRFLDAIDIKILEMIKSIIKMAINIIEMRAKLAWQWYLRLANHAWAVISGEVLRVLDQFFEKIADKVLSIIDLDGEGVKVMRACLPIDELIKSILDVLEYMKKWYQDLIGSIGIEVNQQVIAAGSGWEEALGIKKAKETLKAIEAMLEFKTTADENRPIEDNRLNAMIAELQDASYTYDLLGTGEEVGDALGTANELTHDIVEICRGLGDWDKIKATAAGALGGEG